MSLCRLEDFEIVVQDAEGEVGEGEGRREGGGTFYVCKKDRTRRITVDRELTFLRSIRIVKV